MNNNNEGSTVNYSEMKVADLKTEAKARNIKGYSSMKKDELIAALEANDKIASGLDNSAKGNVKSLGDFTQYAGVSFIDTIKASIADKREARSAKGRKAGRDAVVHEIISPERKAMAYRLQRGSDTATLTVAQERRLRKTRNRLSV